MIIIIAQNDDDVAMICYDDVVTTPSCIQMLHLMMYFMLHSNRHSMIYFIMHSNMHSIIYFMNAFVHAFHDLFHNAFKHAFHNIFHERIQTCIP